MFDETVFFSSYLSREIEERQAQVMCPAKARTPRIGKPIVKKEVIFDEMAIKVIRNCTTRPAFVAYWLFSGASKSQWHKRKKKESSIAKQTVGNYPKRFFFSIFNI